jgi:hypothetical protein
MIWEHSQNVRGNTHLPKLTYRTAINGSPAWQNWLRNFAKQQRIGPSQLIDAALTAHAKATGYEPPPARIDAKTRDVESLEAGQASINDIRKARGFDPLPDPEADQRHSTTDMVAKLKASVDALPSLNSKD